MSMKIKKAKYWIKLTIIFLLSLMLCGVVTNIIYIIKSHDDFKPKSYRSDFELINITNPLEKWEYKALITAYIDTPHIYMETEFKEVTTTGEAHPLIRLVLVDKRIDNVTYAYTLAHELVHVKYQTGNETWVTFKAFTLLFESGCKPLQEVALQFAEEQLNGEIFSNEYDCSYYIFEYLLSHGIV